MFDKIKIEVKETDVDRLFSEYLITEFAEPLSDFKGGNNSIVMREFITDLIWTFGSEPFVGPWLEVEITIFDSLIIALLKLTDEIMQGCIGPFEL